MRALDRKLLRDLRRMRGQVVTIALVVASGIATLLSLVTTWESLVGSRDEYYASAHFADVFAHVQRAPESVRARLQALPGVAAVQTGLVEAERVEVPGFEEPVRGRFVSFSPDQPLNRLYVRKGRLPERDDEVAVNELFARAHHLEPGARITGVLEGRKTPLRVTGVVTSPEYIWVLAENTFVQDDRRFGVFWMRRDGLESALKMESEFNDVALSLAPGASEAQVIDEVDRVLAPYGSFGAYGRDKQASNRLVRQELRQLQGTATVLPLIFLGVAAFLLNVLLGRIVGTQREQIATLKALGYPNRRLGLHYAQLALVVVALGTVLGAAGGAWGGSAFIRLYSRYFRFPVLRYELDLRALLIGVVVSLGAALLGAWGAVRRVARLAPAEAMNPEAPQLYRPTLVERWRLDRFLPVAARMVLRDLERQPWRTALSAVGIAFATAIVAVGNIALDSIHHVFDVQFEGAERQDLTVGFVSPMPWRALDDVRTLPGILRLEPRWSEPVRLRQGPWSRETQLQALFAGTTLQRVLDAREEPVPLPPEGIVLTKVLADRLHVKLGEKVQLEVLEGERRVEPVVVSAIVESWIGTVAYMRAEALGRLLDRDPQVSELLLLVDPLRQDLLSKELRDFPNVTAVDRRDTLRAQFERQLAESFVVLQTVLIGFAAVIAVGVVYNNARIALEIRSRDLATLRILGFQRDEVSAILVGEQAVQLLIGIPLGLPLGRLIAAAVYSRTDPELYRLPVLLTGKTMATSAIVVLLAGLVSAFLVRRKANRLDLVSVLKARD